MKYLMSCGHVSNALNGDGNPCCVICSCHDVKTELPDTPTAGLEGRHATCAYCNKEVDSRWTLPFFEYRPDKETDEYYCGCMGWD